MGWNDEAQILAIVFCFGWAFSGFALGALTYEGIGKKLEALVWMCLLAQIIVVARAVFVGYVSLVEGALLFGVSGALALLLLYRTNQAAPTTMEFGVPAQPASLVGEGTAPKVRPESVLERREVAEGQAEPGSQGVQEV